MPNKRFLIVIPVFTHVLPKAFYPYMAMALRLAKDWGHVYGFDVMQAERQLLHTVMNRAVEAVLANPDYVGMIVMDDDCPPQDSDAASQLVRHFESGKEFISAMGYMRNYPHTTTIGRWYEEGPTYIQETGEWQGFYWLDSLPKRERGLIEADFCGFPLTVIARSLLERVEKPAFGHMDENGGQMTHDIYFCRKAQKAGGKILIDTRVECGHIGEAPVITSVTRDVSRAAVSWAKKAEEAAQVVSATPSDEVLA